LSFDEQDALGALKTHDLDLHRHSVADMAEYGHVP
jgi:hypothetical protein